ncbi:DUF4954 family protein [Prolixibacteraceae bacterium Z1-6]|uniref:DUF4954 family protein n=1 Tax=Draconibacterium aestuarii TaxID=2998507 RepID=A0A9X3FDQ1_9BACT|nr:DUF4954 family protein [Prolixibacteraceae bacterium Z1-6]
MYRQLSQAEIEILKQQGCVAENWENVEVSISFSAEGISNVRFAGNIKLGTQRGKVQIDEGILKPATIRNCFIENCTIGENVFLSNVGSLINYKLGNQVVIENVGSVVVSGKSAFGNGHEIEVLNEGGGRELPVFDKLSAQIAYLLVIYRHNSTLIEKLKKLVSKYVETKRSIVGEIGENSIIQHTKSIKNVKIGPFAKIIGASKLVEGTIDSKQEAPVYIGEEVVAEDFIVLSGSKIDGSAILTSTFVGQGVKIGRQFSAENTTLFANSEAFHGEACSVFAGPYTVTHHKSTLLIAGMFSFYNAGSGSNQSNHMYKLGPIHQGIVERGSKTGSLSYMLWPCRVGAFSVVMNKHAGNFDTTELPFSYISVSDGKSVLTPAMNLFTVGTARDSKKWPTRDRRTGSEKLDLISFELFNPYIIQKIIDGSELLNKLHETTPKSKEFAKHKGVHINRLMLRTSKRYYDLAVNVFLTNQLVERLKDKSYSSLHEIIKLLKPAVESGCEKWIDLLGMIAEKKAINNLIELVCNEEIKTVENLQNGFVKIQKESAERSYAWSIAKLKALQNIDVSQISKQELITIVSDWKTNSIKFKNMILKDAEKEFDQLSRIGFGIDGDDDTENTADFEAIRGTYTNNSFIIGLKNEIAEIDSTYTTVIKKLEKLPE